MLNEISFYLLAAVTLVFAAAAVALRQLVHCAICAAAAFAGLAMIYVELDAQFVGCAQLLVYVGAIAILIVFAVLLTRGDEVRPGGKKSSNSRPAGVLVAALLFAGIVIPILASPSLQHAAPPVANAPVKQIGELLMTQYVLPLEMVGVLLTAALLGAVVLAMRDEPEIRIPAVPATSRQPENKEALSLP